MVSLKEVVSANESLRKQHESLTAVFTGATNGIGLATLKAFAKHIPKPKAIIVGRSRSKFEPELQNLKTINSDGEYVFVEGEISLIKNVDKVAEEIKKQISTFDLLFLSQGFLNISGRSNTPEGLDLSIELRYYSRVRFMEHLVPLMSANGKVVSVFAGGQEGKIFEDDMDVERNWSMTNANGHFTALMTLTNDSFAKQHPDKRFVHAYPGVVATGVMGRQYSGILGFILRIAEYIGDLFFFKTAEESGERMLYHATSEQYGPGSWSLDSEGTPTNVESLVEHREKGMAEKVIEHNQKIFEKVTSS